MGTIVGATIINAASSTKNADKARDPEMHQTKRGNQWYFGMKPHFGVDSHSKLIHAVQTTPAHVADSTVLPDLLHGNETRVWVDQAYRGQRAVIRQRARAPETLSTGAIAIVVLWTRPSGRKTAPNRRCGPKSSIRSGSSSECLVSPMCVIAGSRRTLIDCS